MQKIFIPTDSFIMRCIKHVRLDMTHSNFEPNLQMISFLVATGGFTVMVYEYWEYLSGSNSVATL